MLWPFVERIEIAAAVSFTPLVLAVLALLRAGPYRRLANPNELVRRSHRPWSLRAALVAILAAAVVIAPLLFAIRANLLRSFVTEAFLHGGAGAWLGIAAFAASMVCELVVVAHLLYYLKLCYDGAARYRLDEPPPRLDGALPAAVVLIPACDEDPATLRRPFESLHHIHYPKCRVILVENSRDPERKREALALAGLYGIEAFDLPNRGTKAAALDEARARLGDDVRYLAVLDADQRLEGDLVSDLVALLEADPKLGWVQTPQTYDLSERPSLLQTAIAQNLGVLFDSALQGKDVRRLCPLLGTAFLLRLEALDAVGGWKAEYINEDTPTAYFMQLRGWDGRYLQRVYTAGIAPPTFEALHRQQVRWSHANSLLALEILRGFLRRERRSTRVVADYLSFGSYELITCLIAVLALLPTAYLVGSFFWTGDTFLGAELEPLQWAFASLYPFYVVLLFFPHVNLGLRGHPLRNLLLAQGLHTCLGPSYFKGVRRSLLGEIAIFESAIRHRGGATERGGAARQAVRALASPQLAAFVVFASTGSVSAYMAALYPGSPFGWIVLFWSAFNAVSVGHFAFFAFDAEASEAGEAAKARAPATPNDGRPAGARRSA